MEYRKLISFGKSSYVVSLPKAWITKQKLKKGDVIYFDEQDNNLLLQPNASGEKLEEKEITLNIDGKDFRRIQREIISAYLKNYKVISLLGNEIKDKAKNIQVFIQNLVALEILEQNQKKIVARDFLDINDVSLDQLIRKMDMITRSMLEDCQKMFQEDTYDNIYLRDNDVNKFRFLIFRIVWFGMEKPLFVLKKFNLNQIDLLNLWWLAFNLEGIDDYTKRIARYMRKTKFTPKNQQKFEKLIGYLRESYIQMMKGYYTQNQEIAHQILQKREELLKQCDDFYFKNRNVAFVGYLIHNTKSLLTSIHTISRIILNPQQSIPNP